MNAYDPKCLELAHHFTHHADACACPVCDQLAQDIQDAVEMSFVAKESEL